MGWWTVSAKGLLWVLTHSFPGIYIEQAMAANVFAAFMSEKVGRRWGGQPGNHVCA